MASNRDLRKQTKGLLSGINLPVQAVNENAEPSSSTVDSAYIQELNDEIESLRQQVKGAMVKSGNSYSFRRFQLTPVGIISPENIDDREFSELGFALSTLSGAVNFWLGDWANLYIDQKQKEKGKELSEEERGEIYIELVRDFGLSSIRSLQQYASVCRSVPPSIRIEGVSFSHHQLVAFLPKALKGRESEFLRRAVGLTVEDFRSLIMSEQGKFIPDKTIPSFDTAPLVKDFKAVTKLFSLSDDARLPKKKKAEYREKIQGLRRLLDELESKIED